MNNRLIPAMVAVIGVLLLVVGGYCLVLAIFFGSTFGLFPLIDGLCLFDSTYGIFYFLLGVAVTVQGYRMYESKTS